MRPVEAIKTCLMKAFTWEGRASRSEFWWFAAPWFLVSSLLLLRASSYFETGRRMPLIYAFIAANIPVVTAAVRRLTDSGTIESRASYVGWGFAGLMTGPGLYIIWNDTVQRDGSYWMVPVMIFATIGGLITLGYLLSAPSKSQSTPEVSK